MLGDAYRSRVWVAESARQHVLARVTEAARAAQGTGVRPRLVIFDYMDSPVAGQLRAMAQDLNMLVGMEPFERSLPSATLRDRFRLLEKSKGIHGIFFPAGMTQAHRACLQAHPALAGLAIDRGSEGLSPLAVSFLQLAAVHGWNPEGRVATLVHCATTNMVAQALANELQALGMKASLVAHPEESQQGALSRSSLIWLCHGHPLSTNRLHLPNDAVIVDSGRAMEIGASFSEAQSRLLGHRLYGFCPADGGLASLLNLNRIQRLLQRALGPRRLRATTSVGYRAKG